MGKNKPKKTKLSKPVALILVILMMGTTIGMFIGVFTKSSDKVEVPANRIIKYRMTEPQFKELLKNYQTILEYEYPSYCLDCSSFLASLEQWTMSSDNQIYLQEIQVDSSSSEKLTITSLRGQKILYDPSEDEARNTVCDMLISRSLFCVEI